jgi:two-component system nitrate/nitrite response regulator NarL
MSESIQIVIVDDHPLFREGVAHTLAAQPDIEVVAEGASADDAIRLAEEFLPDLMLVDITMPGGGLHATQVIATTCPATKIVMLTASEEEDDLMAALKAGARAYILKGVPARELIGILRAVYAGEVYVPPTLATSLLIEMTGARHSTRQPADPFAELTERERQILEGVAAGLSNKEIGQQLYLSEKTVKHYMTNILQKLQVRNRVEAALMAQKSARRETKQP